MGDKTSTSTLSQPFLPETHPHNLMSPTWREQTPPPSRRPATELPPLPLRPVWKKTTTCVQHCCLPLNPNSLTPQPQLPHTLANAHSNPSNKMPACVLPGIYASCPETALLTMQPLPCPVSSHHLGQLCTQLRRACKKPGNVFVEGRASPVL